MVNYLLQSIASYGKLLLWYLVRFFNKAVKNYDFSPDQGTEKCSADSFVSFGTDFEKAVPQRPCVWHSQIGAMRFHTDGQRAKPRTQTDRQASNSA